MGVAILHPISADRPCARACELALGCGNPAAMSRCRGYAGPDEGPRAMELHLASVACSEPGSAEGCHDALCLPSMPDSTPRVIGRVGASQ